VLDVFFIIFAYHAIWVVAPVFVMVYVMDWS